MITTLILSTLFAPEFIPDWLWPDWEPVFTEQWATTYVQLLFAAFLFALGVPTAIYNWIVDDDIKHVIPKRLKLGLYYALSVILFLAVIGFIWGPLRHSIQSAAAQPAGQTRVLVVADEERARELLQGVQEQARPQDYDDNHATLKLHRRARLAAAAVTFLPAIVLFAGLWVNRQFKRHVVVRDLTRRLGRKFKRRGYLDEKMLYRLGYLGEHGRPGGEKKLVFDAFDRLARDVQRNRWKPWEYKGSELEELIRHVGRALDNEFRPGSDENYRQAMLVLGNIWRRLQSRPSLPADATSVHETIKHLGLLVVTHKSERTALAYLQEAAACDSDIVFEMGLAAFREAKYLTAVAALNTLESMAADMGRERVRDTEVEIVSNLLGLVAHFSAGGASACQRAQTSLSVGSELFRPTLRQSLDEAFDYQYNAGRYETADEIRRLARRAAKMASVDLDAPASGPASPPDADPAAEVTESPPAGGDRPRRGLLAALVGLARALAARGRAIIARR